MGVRSAKMERTKVMDSKKFVTKTDPEDGREFTGRVESIMVSGAGSHFQFDLLNNKKVHCAYVLSSTNLSAFSTKAALITSAYAIGKKIHVRGEANSDGLPIVVDIRVGAKSKVLSNKKIELKVGVKSPVAEAHQAA